MYEAVEREIGGCELAVFSAAVADYRPLKVAEQKIKKSKGRLVVELERTEDVLGSARAVFGFTGYLVGFAAETQDVAVGALDKLRRKGCDLVIANDVSEPGIGFDSEENRVTLYFASGELGEVPQQSKLALARCLIQMILERCG
jgi:phosphopantothenate-cysteine ligase/phosphopantothenoylcysteine decarboxylase/phosphopantothenate--cysteine ligase